MPKRIHKLDGQKQQVAQLASEDDPSASAQARPPAPRRAGALRALVTGENDNTVTFQLYDAAGNILDGELEAAKDFEVCRQTYDGQTYGGAAYTYASASSRTADDGSNPPVTQNIIPPYRANVSQILVERPENGTWVEGVEWIDTTPRHFADEPAA